MEEIEKTGSEGEERHWSLLSTHVILKATKKGIEEILLYSP